MRKHENKRGRKQKLYCCIIIHYYVLQRNIALLTNVCCPTVIKTFVSACKTIHFAIILSKARKEIILRWCTNAYNSVNAYVPHMYVHDMYIHVCGSMYTRATRVQTQTKGVYHTFCTDRCMRLWGKCKLYYCIRCVYRALIKDKLLF